MPDVSERAALEAIVVSHGAEAPRHNPLLNAAVYAGIAAKLAASLAVSAFRRARSRFDSDSG